MRHARPLLLVEDNLDQALMIQRTLAEADVPQIVIHRPDAESAIAYLRSTADPRPSLILLDLNLPGISGIEFLRLVKEDASLAGIPVVILSVSDAPRDILCSFDLSVAGYIVKPGDYESLVRTVKVVQDYWSLSHLPAYQS